MPVIEVTLVEGRSPKQMRTPGYRSHPGDRHLRSPGLHARLSRAVVSSQAIAVAAD
jgi:hypothetical protein